MEEQGPIKDKRIVVIGAGGAAKAIIYTAHQKGAHVIIVNRDGDKAEALASKVGCQGGGLETMDAIIQNGYDVIIKCTPVSASFNENWILPGTVAMDITNIPKETPFLIAAQKKSCKIVYGYKMFVYQAIGQWKIWNLLQGNIEPYRQIFEEASLKAVTERKPEG